MANRDGSVGSVGSVGICRVWVVATELALKSIGEQSSGLGYMHTSAFRSYKRANLWFILPVIAIQAITGAGNYAQPSLPPAWQNSASQIIGGMCLIACLVISFHQKLGWSKTEEGHRIAMVAYFKLAGDIRVALSLPPGERSLPGQEFLNQAHREFERLREQSPYMPRAQITKYKAAQRASPLETIPPDIVELRPIDIFNASVGTPGPMTETCDADTERFRKPPVPLRAKRSQHLDDMYNIHVPEELSETETKDNFVDAAIDTAHAPFTTGIAHATPARDASFDVESGTIRDAEAGGESGTNVDEA